MASKSSLAINIRKHFLFTQVSLTPHVCLCSSSEFASCQALLFIPLVTDFQIALTFPTSVSPSPCFPVLKYLYLTSSPAILNLISSCHPPMALVVLFFFPKQSQTFLTNFIRISQPHHNLHFELENSLW